MKNYRPVKIHRAPARQLCLAALFFGWSACAHAATDRPKTLNIAVLPRDVGEVINIPVSSITSPSEPIASANAPTAIEKNASAESEPRPGAAMISSAVLQAQLMSTASVAKQPLQPSLTAYELTLEQAVQQAVNWHPSIAEAISSIEQQQQQVNVARAGYYPQVSGQLRNGYESGSNNGQQQAFVLSVSQMLYDFGKVKSSVNAAQAVVAQQQARTLMSIDQTVRDTATAFVELQRYQRLIEVADAQIAGVSTIAELARVRYERGASTRSDMVQAMGRAEAAKIAKETYSAQLSRWQVTLSSLLGNRPIHEVSDAFPEHLKQPVTAASASPEVLIAMARRVEATELIAQSRAEGLPTLSIEPSVTHNFNNAGSDAGLSRDQTQYGVFLNVRMPLYQGGANSARRAAAEAALSSADAATDTARMIAAQNLAQAQSQQTALRRSLPLLDNQEKIGAQTRDLYRQQYLELGTRPLLDLLNAEQEIHQARIQRQQTVSDLRNLSVQGLYSAGQLRSAFNLENNVIQGIEIRL